MPSIKMWYQNEVGNLFNNQPMMTTDADIFWTSKCSETRRMPVTVNHCIYSNFQNCVAYTLCYFTGVRKEILEFFFIFCITANVLYLVYYITNQKYNLLQISTLTCIFLNLIKNMSEKMKTVKKVYYWVKVKFSPEKMIGLNHKLCHVRGNSLHLPWYLLIF